MNITDYAREPGKLADLLEAVIFGGGNSINGRQLLLLRNAMDDLRGVGATAIKRLVDLQNEARTKHWFSENIILRDLTFADVHAFIWRSDCPDMCADGPQVMTAYYTTYEDDEERVRVALHCVVPTVPLVIKGEERDLVIGAGVDIRQDLTKDRLDEIKDKVRDAIRMLQGEARVDVAMAEAA